MAGNHVLLLRLCLSEEATSEYSLKLGDGLGDFRMNKCLLLYIANATSEAASAYRLDRNDAAY